MCVGEAFPTVDVLFGIAGFFAFPFGVAAGVFVVDFVIVFAAVVRDADAVASVAACRRRLLVAAVRWLVPFPGGVADGSAGIGGRASTLNHRPLLLMRRGQLPVSIPARERLRSADFATVYRNVGQSFIFTTCLVESLLFLVA